MKHPAHNIMLSAAGRRVALMRLLERSIQELRVAGSVIATDITMNSPAMHVASQHVLVPPYRDPQCLAFLLELCHTRSVRLIVPTIDTELGFYARHAEQFLAAGCHINICSAETNDIAFDKQRTHAWLTEHSIPTVRQASLEHFLEDRGGFAFPLVVKPRRGSSSVGVSMANDIRHLHARAGEPDLLVQSRASGHEYTVDLFIDRAGRCRCAVPRLRMETRGGEVSKGITVRHPGVIALARRVAEALPGAFGVLNVQIFADDDAQLPRLAVIEINPRFGGGYPLAHEAGAPMARWLLEDVLNLPCTASDADWREGVVMFRYDEAVFIPPVEA